MVSVRNLRLRNGIKLKVIFDESRVASWVIKSIYYYDILLTLFALKENRITTFMTSETHTQFLWRLLIDSKKTQTARKNFPGDMSEDAIRF